MSRNLATSLRKRRRTAPMDSYDRLPVVLRDWLSTAALPWSPASVLKLWKRALRAAGGDIDAALTRLDQVQLKMLERDAPRVWAVVHPSVQIEAKERLLEHN